MKPNVTFLSLPLALAAGCGTPDPPGVDLGGPPLASVFQSQVINDDILFVRAQYREDTEDIFGEDMVDEYRVLPVWLELKIQSGNLQDNRRINPETWDMKLYLQDGTVLSHVPRAVVTAAVDDEEVRLRIDQQAYKGGLVDSKTDGIGFVFFSVPDSDDFEFLDRRHLARTANDRSKVVEPGRSLLSFEVTDPTGDVRKVFVGLTY